MTSKPTHYARVLSLFALPSQHDLLAILPQKVSRPKEFFSPSEIGCSC